MDWIEVILGSTIIAAILTNIIPKHEVKLKYITEERQNWRYWIRDNSVKLLTLMDKECKDKLQISYCNKCNNYKVCDEINELIYGFRMRLNPNSYRDQLIIENLESMKLDLEAHYLTKKELEAAQNRYNENKKNVVNLLEVMLKDEWERAKKEVKKIW